MKILVVDDSKTMRYVLINQLRELGYNLIIEADCVDKAKLLLSVETPALIISDWNMPNASGLDFLKYVRNNSATKDVPFVMLTTETDRNKIIEATRSGLQSYLLKPIRKSVLLEKMRELASAYNFTPPREASGTVITVTAVQENHPLKGKLKREQVPKILEAYCGVWLNEMTVSQFEDFIAKDVFNDPMKLNPEDIASFIKLLLTSAQTAVESRLLALTE
ncbi:MAG: response regulator [Fibrobacterota bacterium]|nr:response regulator [Chitinispirillaceae bacterium]